MPGSPEGKNLDVRKMTSRLLKGIKDGLVENEPKPLNIIPIQQDFNEDNDFNSESLGAEVSGNGKNSTPPYGVKRPVLTTNSEIIPIVEDPPTVIHSYMFTEELRTHVARTVSSMTLDKELLEDVFIKLAATDLAGGNREGFLPLVSFSVQKRPGSVRVSDEVLHDLIGTNLNVDLNYLSPGLHNFFDQVGLIYQISITEGNIFSGKKFSDVTLALNVPKI